MSKRNGIAAKTYGKEIRDTGTERDERKLLLWFKQLQLAFVKYIYVCEDKKKNSKIKMMEVRDKKDMERKERKLLTDAQLLRCIIRMTKRVPHRNGGEEKSL